LKLLKAANSNNVEVVKSKIGSKGSSIPRVAARTLFGYDDDDGIKLEIEASDEVEMIETDLMNPLELACVRGNAEILKYFINDLNLNAKREFSSQDLNEKSIEEMHFIYVPIIKKHNAVFEILMNMPTLWSKDEIN